MMEFTCNVDEKCHSTRYTCYFPEVLPHLFCRTIYSIAVALVFTAVLHIFTCGGREVGACGKDEVLPQPDGSILSGGTAHQLRLFVTCCKLKTNKTGSAFVLKFSGDS